MASTTPVERVPSADGTEIAFERRGRGPPLVLVHGTTADRTRWAPVSPALEEHHAVYVLDRRGYGESADVQRTESAEPTRTSGSGDVAERSSAGRSEAYASGDVQRTNSADPAGTEGSGDAPAYSLEREADDAVAVVDSIGEPAILLGHSYGALCALEAALRTDNLRGLVLYEPAFSVGEGKLYSEELLAEMESLLRDGENERLLVLLFEEIVGLSPAEMDALRSAPNWPARVEAAPVVLRETLAENGYEFDPARFADLTVPTLLLTGDESPALLRDPTAALADALPNGRVVVFEGQGHAAVNTAPELFVDELLAFTRELD